MEIQDKQGVKGGLKKAPFKENDEELKNFREVGEKLNKNIQRYKEFEKLNSVYAFMDEYNVQVAALTVKVTVGQFDRFISQDEKDRLERKKKDDEARKAAEEQQDPAKAANPSPSKLGKPAK